MSWITREDFRDVYIKALQRGFGFLGSKLTTNQRERTKSAFNSLTIENANWWTIPEVRKRWNEKITGDRELPYEKYLSEKFYQSTEEVHMLSLGSGICSHEIFLAEINPNWKVSCIDISESLINRARQISSEKGLSNIEFIAADIYEIELAEESYDMIFFHSALHHFDNIEHFVELKVCRSLKPGGNVVINEYVGPNRMQYPTHQIKAINEALVSIPSEYRRIFKTSLTKDRYYGSGKLRMRIADPSECVDSESILPVLRSNFEVLEERPYGGNLLMSVLKDISHHFIDLDDRKSNVLNALFAFEDAYLDKYESDFVFGVYQKKN